MTSAENQKTFDEMNKRERIEFIFNLHNGKAIENEINEVLNESYLFQPSFESNLKFINKSNQVVKLDEMGNIIECPEHLEDFLKSIIETRLIKTNEMINQIF